MIVYMLLNTKTEMAYVGSTELALEARFKQHWDKCVSKTSPLARAMQETLKHEWERVTLEEFDDLESMLRAEVDWMFELETIRPRVGYNSQVPSEQDIQAKLKAGGSVARTQAAPNRAARRREEMTEEELEFFREMGRRGAERSAALGEVTPTEVRVENGRKGAAAVWSKPGAKERHAERTVPALKAGHKSWWDSLPEEEKERRREMGRQAGKEGGRLGGRPGKKSTNGGTGV